MISNNPIILLTNQEDLTCDFVVQALMKADLPFERLNTELWFKSDNLSLMFPECLPSGILDFFEKAQAIYFRRPKLPDLSHLENDKDVLSYCQREWQVFYDSLFACYKNHCLWVNSPYDIRIAENKPYQLQTAIRVGLQVPETRITNSKLLIKELIKKHKAIILKPLYSAHISSLKGEEVIFANKVSSIQNISDQELQMAPVVAQQWIDKAYDLRVTIIGEEVFAVKIHSQTHPETQTDWRAGNSVIPLHTIYHLPLAIASACLKLTRHLNLPFGAIDLGSVDIHLSQR